MQKHNFAKISANQTIFRAHLRKLIYLANYFHLFSCTLVIEQYKNFENLRRGLLELSRNFKDFHHQS